MNNPSESFHMERIEKIQCQDDILLCLARAAMSKRVLQLKVGQRLRDVSTENHLSNPD